MKVGEVAILRQNLDKVSSISHANISKFTRATHYSLRQLRNIMQSSTLFEMLVMLWRHSTTRLPAHIPRR